jgi:hypothetical protein
MCSRAGENPGPGGRAQSRAAALDRLGAAIEELAAAAQCRAGGGPDITERLARLWEMVAALDPELARRLAEYDG